MEDATRSGSLIGRRYLLLLGFLAVGLVSLAACGGKGANTGNGTPTPPYKKSEAAAIVVEALKEQYQTYLAHDWAALYNLYEDTDKTGCTQEAFVARMQQIYSENQTAMDQGFQIKLMAVEKGGIKITPAKITADRISYSIAEGTSATMTVGAIALQNGKWVIATVPLGQDCAQIILPTGILPH